MVKRGAVALALLLLMGCDTLDIKGLFMPTGPVVDRRFEQSMALHGGKPVARIEAGDSYLFYVCTDTHVADTYNNLREFSSLLRNDSEALFGVVLGDCIDRRNALPNYVEAIEWISDEQRYDSPIYSLLGNHDLFFCGWDNYVDLLGPSVYWFEISNPTGSDLFIALDSASGTLGGRQMRWLEEFLSAERDHYRHCVVLTHTNIFYTDNSQISSGNMPLEESHLLLDMFSNQRVTLCLQGHDHYREDLTFGNVRYTVVGTISDEADKPEFLTIRLSDDGAEYEWKYL